MTPDNVDIKIGIYVALINHNGDVMAYKKDGKLWEWADGFGIVLERLLDRLTCTNDIDINTPLARFLFWVLRWLSPPKGE